MRCVLQALLTVSLVATAATQAYAETASCSAAYHTALDELRKAKGDDLTNAVAILRAADPVLPGQWIFSRSLFAKAGRNARLIEQERICAERIKVAGRFRCTKYAEAATPDVPVELTITPAPTSDELRILKAVGDLVEGRGAIPDVGANGRHTWLSQRASSDLRLYISQPAHPALCSGAREISEFYLTALKPLQKRADDVIDLVKRTRNLAATRVVAASEPAPRTEAALLTSAVSVPAPAPERLVAADVAALPLVAMTAAAVRAVLPAADVETILQERAALSALQRAKPALIMAQVEAEKADDAKREQVLAAGRAVRMIEAAAYTELYADRYRQFARSVLSLPREIQQAHAQACTCAN